MPHAFDRALFVRTALVMAGGFVALTSIVAATDEAVSSTGMRLARIAALGPGVAALGVIAVTAHARSRGELACIEALGTPPWRAANGAALAGWCAAACAALLLFLPSTDPSSLFPIVRRSLVWTFLGDTEARALGVTVFADGTLRLSTGSTFGAPVSPGAWAATACVAPLAAAAPAWAVTPMSGAWRAASIAASTVLAVLALHLVAAGRLHAVASIVAALPLALSTLAARTRS